MGFEELLGVNDLKAGKNKLWKALLAEFVGNILLNLFGCMACISEDPVRIALTFGFVIFVVVQAIGHVSGGHINPAVTAGILVAGNISVIKAILYVIVQSLGAITGSALMKGLTNSTAGVTGLSKHVGIDVAEGFGIEFFLGFILVFTVFGVCDPNRPEAKAAAALAIGFAVAIGHLTTVQLTGSSMNPARSFGSAVVANAWDDHWVYWIGPIGGGIVAALLYKFCFSAPALGPVKIIERYTTAADERELKHLAGGNDV